MRNVIFAISCCVAVCGFAAPRVLNVTMPQPQYLSTFEETITIGYDLEGETSIVTLDILTNGVSIGAANVVSVSGDVNKKVEPGNGKSIVWQAYQDWPDHKITNRIVQAKVTAWSLDNPPDVMVVDLLEKSNVVFYAALEQLPGGVGDNIYKTDKLVMRKIPAGGSVFTMGESGGSGARFPHFVAFTNDFYLGVFPVTQKQYSDLFAHQSWLVTNTSWTNNPSSYQDAADSPYCPVDNIRTSYLRNIYGAHRSFEDVSLEQMATEYPITLEELKGIQGVGEGKVKQPYAKEFVDLIKRYCEENNITRQVDLRVRTVAKKSLLKVKIIQNIDRQIALDDIATAQNIDFDDLLDEVEAIVYSGTKLNIDYFLEEVMDEDRVDEIYDYFAESDTDDLETAIQELGGDEDEIRLVRIKFISDMAN